MSLSPQLQRLRDRVEEAGGVLTLTMEQVRNACGFERIGSNVPGRIAHRLTRAGFGFIGGLEDEPVDRLPSHRFSEVRIYLRNTPVGRIIDAALKPGKSSDDLLLEAASDAHEKLDRLRESFREILGD